MSKEPNPTWIGGFVVGAVAITVVGVLTFGSGTAFREDFRVVAHFESSVAGLDVGAPVRFRGVRIGTVSDISAVWDLRLDNIRIPVELTLFRNSVRAPEAALEESLEERDPYDVVLDLIDLGLRAELLQDSFVTGKLYVALDFYPDTPKRLLGGVTQLEMPTTEAGLAKVRKSIEELPIQEFLESAMATAKALEELITSPEPKSILRQVDRLLKTLNRELGPLVEDLEQTLDGAQTLLATTEGEVQSLSKETQSLLNSADRNYVPTVLETLNELRVTLTEVRRLFGEDQRLVPQFRDLLDETTEAVRAIRVLADYLERHPEALLSGKRE